MEPTSRTMSWVVWFSQTGSAEMERGSFLEAARSYETSLLCLLVEAEQCSAPAMPDAVVPAAGFASLTQWLDCNTIRSHDHYEPSWTHCFLFVKTLGGIEQQEISASDLQTHHAVLLLNFSISLHCAGIAAGTEGLIASAKTTYQAVLQFLVLIDRSYAIRIGVYAFQNLAILHYMQFDYDQCLQFLQSLYLLVQLGYEESILDESELAKVSMAMFFYSQPPTTAGSA